MIRIKRLFTTVKHGNLFKKTLLYSTINFKKPLKNNFKNKVYSNNSNVELQIHHSFVERIK